MQNTIAVTSAAQLCVASVSNQLYARVMCLIVHPSHGYSTIHTTDVVLVCEYAAITFSIIIHQTNQVHCGGSPRLRRTDLLKNSVLECVRC